MSQESLEPEQPELRNTHEGPGFSLMTVTAMHPSDAKRFAPCEALLHW